MMNVTKTPQGLEVRGVFTPVEQRYPGVKYGHVLMQKKHATKHVANVTSIKAQSKRYLSAKWVASELENVRPNLVMFTVPCITHVAEEKVFDTWDEYPVVVLNNDTHLPTVVLNSPMAPVACEQLEDGTAEDVMEVMHDQQEWMKRFPEVAVVLAHRGRVNRVWHYEHATGMCNESDVTVYSSREPSRERINGLA